MLRGIKTLGVRMDRHCDNAERDRGLLLAAPEGSPQVHYPGLAMHPGHEIAAKQMKRFGGMVSFRVVGGVEQALDRLRPSEAVHARLSRSAASSR